MNGEWKEGYYSEFSYEQGQGNFICDSDFDYTVHPETVGQYSGRIDKNNVKMFEGDIVTGLFLHSMPVNGVVSFRDGSFGLLWDRAGAETFTPFTSMCNVEYEVIGNIHDTPELLEGGDQK